MFSVLSHSFSLIGCLLLCAVFQLEAEQMMEQLIHWVRVDSSGLGRPQLPGDVPTNSMAVPMMLLCLVQQLSDGRGQEVAQRYRELSGWCVQQILQHVQVRHTEPDRGFKHDFRQSQRRERKEVKLTATKGEMRI